jgi:hypothetical protein
MTIERVARPDDQRFDRAIEVSIRGRHRDELKPWKLVEEKKVGPFTITVRQNPEPVKIVEEVIKLVGSERMVVTQNDTACAFTRGAFGSTGYLFGPALPAEHYACPGAMVGIILMPVLDYAPRRCILAQPPGGTAVTRVRFKDVTFGRGVHGHHGLFVDMEREKKGTPVTLVVKANDQDIGRITHHDGDGWKPFELMTEDMAGKKGDLVFEVSAANNQNRIYCFEADTR